VRVLFLIDGVGAGGAERQARILLCGMPRDRVEFTLGCFGGDPADIALIESAGVPIRLLPNRPRRIWPLLLVLHLARLVDREKVDVIQSFLPTFDVLAPCVGALRPRVTVVTSRRNVVEQLDPGRRRLLRVTAPRVHAVVANAEAGAASVRRLEPWLGGRARVIPNAIVVPEPVSDGERMEARRELGLEPGAFAVAYVAHFRDGKGHEHLPPVIEKVASVNPRVRFLLAGDTESNRVYRRNRQRLDEDLRNRGLEDRVLVLGMVKNARSVLAAAAAFLNLSDVEGMSNAVAEAMALGIPVVATDAGGTAELIRDSVDGFIVPRGDAAAAAERLLALASSPELRARLGAAARGRIRDSFSVESMVDRYARLYEEARP
jgi:glycosyltransferase involved in cell wall biosynthesis